MNGSTNMVAVNLANAVAGPYFLGFISAVAFATILAVVAGLTLAGASAVSHDLYAQVFARGRTTERTEVNLSKAAAVVIGLVAIYLGYVFENQNVAFMVGLAFSVARELQLPGPGDVDPVEGHHDPRRPGRRARRPRHRGGDGGAVEGGVGHHLRPCRSPVPLRQPGPVLDADRVPRHLARLEDGQQRPAKRERAAFEAQFVRSETGIGAAGAHAH